MRNDKKLNNITYLSFELNNEIINLVFFSAGFLFMVSCMKYVPLAIFGAGMAFSAIINETNLIARILFKNKGGN